MNTSDKTHIGESTLTLSNISKRYGALTALADVSFELKRGEFLTMLGPSGSGKTTTLRVIAGFLTPDTGNVVMHGRDVISVPPNRRNIGMVFQDYALFPHMTIAENIGFPLETRGVGKAERRRQVSEMLDVVGLSGFEDRRPKQLSGGQQQRTALARALIFGPEIVLLDEPMAALDKKLRSTMQLEILRIAKQFGATVISVTHDQEEALVMSDRIALFNAGRLEQLGTPYDIYRNPRTEFVADFIGEANLLPGLVAGQTSGAIIAGPGWTAEVPPAFGAVHVGDREVCVVIRPETIRLAGISGERNGNCATGTLTDKIYLGVEYKLIFALRDGQKIHVRSREMRGMENLKIGSTAELTWDTSDAVILRSSQSKQA